MSNSLGDILPTERFARPEEMQIIKDFIMDKYNQPASVTIKQTQIIITVKGASLAGALRTQMHQLQELCNTKKRLVIRIGS